MSTLNSIELGFRWIDGILLITPQHHADSENAVDVTIDLAGERPNMTLQMKILIAGVESKYNIEKSKPEERTIRQILNQKIACNQTKEIIIQLFECRSKLGVIRKKEQTTSIRILLDDEELYTEKTFQSDDGKVSATLTFAYSPGGYMRDQVENALRFTKEQKVVLDKIRHVHRFFKALEIVCSAVEDLHPIIKFTSTGILSLYKICERQKECSDAARDLVEEMDEVLNHGVEKLSEDLRTNSDTKEAFRTMAGVIGEVSKYVDEQGKGIVGSLLRDGTSTSCKLKLEELHSKFKRAREGLRDSISAGLWKRVVNAGLERKLKSVLSAHYRPGARCLPNTRVALLESLDTWLGGSSSENTAWVYGYAGSGKSALLNSIAKNLEDARIPFTCFSCKRDDAERSDVQRILPTLCYDLTQFYGDYRGKISDVVDQPTGRSISTGDVASQSELLFGEAPSYTVVSPDDARRPRVHVILIDALDECKDFRQRCALARFFRDLANAVPWIKVVITSRRESDIAKVFAGDNTTHRIDINSDEWKTSADIRLLIEDRSKQLELDLSPDQVTRLQEKASGLFIWCSTVFRYIEESKESGSRIVANILKGQPPNSDDNPHAPLYLLYQQVLDSAVTRASDRRLMELVLSVVFVAATQRPLSANAIADILYPNEEGDGRKEKRDWIGNIIKSLLSIVYVEEGTNAVRACHLSVLDFIGGMLTGGFPTTSSIPKQFSIGLKQALERVFKGCFVIMNRQLRFNICELDDSFRLNKDVPDLSTRIAEHITEALQYASVFWFSHIEQSDLKGYGVQVLAFLNSPKTLFWVEVLSLMDIVDRGIVVLQDCARFFTGQPSVSEIADEWERFLLVNRDALRSTPHLYLSALSWLPSNSRLWNIVHGAFSSELPVILNVPEMWNNEKWSENVGSEVRSVAYSANGQLLAAGCGNGKVRLWDARSGKITREPLIAGSWVWSITFSPNNRWLASGHKDCKVRLWDLYADPVVHRVLKGHANSVRSVFFSSDEKRLVSGSQDGSIRVWDVESGTAIGNPFIGHLSFIASVALSADDTRIISGSGDKTVRIWDSATGKQIGEPLQGHSEGVFSVACSRDGRFIASSDKTVILWDAQTYERIGDPLTGYAVCFSADSRYLAFASIDLSASILDVERRSLVCVLRGHTDYIQEISFSPDGQDVLSGSLDGVVRVWKVKESESESIDQPSMSRSAIPSCVSYVPNTGLIASASYDGNIYLWDARTGVAVGRPMQEHTGSIDALAVSNGGQWLVSGSRDKTLRIWDIAAGIALGEPMLGHTDMITSVAVSPDNHFVASASRDNTVRLWDVALRQQKVVLVGHKNWVTSVTFSMDGDYVITGGDDCTIRIWDTQTGETVGHKLEGHSRRVSAVAVSPDGRLIASASCDDTVRIWGVSALSTVHVLKHSNEVLSVAFSGDSQFLISGSWDNTIRVWNVMTGEAAGNLLKGHTLLIISIAISPSGHEFATASQDGSIRIWDVRARTDLESVLEREVDYTELDEDGLRIRWNASRASTGEDDDWIKDEEKLLLWVPWQYRPDIKVGTRLVIRARGKSMVRPEPDHRKMLRYAGRRWKEIYSASGSDERTILMAQRSSEHFNRS